MSERDLGERYGEWLCGRVRKNERRSRDAIRRADTDCMRLYDRDIPEIPLTIDRYGAHLHVALWSRGVEQDAQARERRLRVAVAALADALGIAADAVHWKERARQRGSAQYEARPGASCAVVVREGGLRFLVDLERYVDTGLFLDHRVARARVGAIAAGRRVLNLFSYTGAFTVHAAAGDARTTTSVDLSKTYRDWAEDNLRRNGLLDGDSAAAGGRHAVVAADVFGWIEDALDRRERYELIVCDPPTFSNSKRMRMSFDIARDHVPLLERVIELLAPGGALLFSTNHRGFDFDARVFDALQWRETSAETVPADFRDRRIHRSWWAERP